MFRGFGRFCRHGTSRQKTCRKKSKLLSECFHCFTYMPSSAFSVVGKTMLFFFCSCKNVWNTKNDAFSYHWNLINYRMFLFLSGSSQPRQWVSRTSANVGISNTYQGSLPAEFIWICVPQRQDLSEITVVIRLPILQWHLEARTSWEPNVTHNWRNSRELKVTRNSLIL